MAGGFQTGKSNTLAPGEKETTSKQTTQTTFDPAAKAILTSLLAQLAGGGTGAQQGDRAARTSTINTAQQGLADYSKTAAFADAQGAMTANFNAILAQLLPQLVRQAEGSGTSQNSMRALMTQDAAKKAAESSATLGLKAAADYGGISTNIASVLERLTSGTDPVQAALIQALALGKGQTTTSSSTGYSAPSGGGTASYSAPSNMGGLASFSGTQPVGVRDPYAGMSYYGPANTTYGTGGLTPTMTPNQNMQDMLAGFTF